MPTQAQPPGDSRRGKHKKDKGRDRRSASPVAPATAAPVTPAPVVAPAVAEAAPQVPPAKVGVVAAPRAEDDEAFFKSEVGAGTQLPVDVLDDLEPPTSSGNRTFIAIASLVGLAVAVFVVYLIAFRERPSKPEKVGATPPRAPSTVAARPPLVPALPPVSAAFDAGSAPDAGIAAADAGPVVDAGAALADAGVRAADAGVPADAGVASDEEAKSDDEEEDDARRPARRKPTPPAVATPKPEPPTPPAPPPALAPKPEANPKKAEAATRYRAGSALLMQGQFLRAISEFREALRLDKRQADAHRGLGVAYSQLGRKVSAIRHYEAYLRLRPNAPDRETVRETLLDLKK